MQNQFNQSGVYIILPFKSTYGIPSFEIAQTIFEVFPLPTNNLIQATNHYDIIYLIHIWNVEQAKQNNIQIKFRLNNTSYWNIKGRIIEDVPAHRKVNPISISFKFQIKFMKVVKKYANTGIIALKNLEENSQKGNRIKKFQAEIHDFIEDIG